MKYIDFIIIPYSCSHVWLLFSFSSLIHPIWCLFLSLFFFFSRLLLMTAHKTFTLNFFFSMYFKLLSLYLRTNKRKEWEKERRRKTLFSLYLTSYWSLLLSLLFSLLCFVKKKKEKRKKKTPLFITLPLFCLLPFFYIVSLFLFLYPQFLACFLSVPYFFFFCGTLSSSLPQLSFLWIWVSYIVSDTKRRRREE